LCDVLSVFARRRRSRRQDRPGDIIKKDRLLAA
jgi:hypothetical protein